MVKWMQATALMSAILKLHAQKFNVNILL